MSAIGAGRGEWILAASKWATAAFAVASAAATATRLLRPLALAVSLVLFAAGVVAFLYAYAVAIGRSTDEVVSVPGVFFLKGSAPKRVRRVLIALLLAQVAIALVAASMRPFTSLAFGILVPMFGVAMCGLWGARHGEFPPRSATR